MNSNIHHLELVVRNRDEYFTSGPARAIEYVQRAIGFALRAAVNDVKAIILPGHDVDTTQTTDIVHYTSLQALFAMVHEEAEPSDLSDGELVTDHRFLRLYDSANLNDPSEGAYFLERFTDASDVVQVPAYIASFVAPSETAQNPVRDARDNLVFWRHYGRDGTGCSISVPANRFAPGRSDLVLRSVTYGSQEAEKDAEKLKTIMRCLDPIVAQVSRDSRLRRQVAATILESLGEIPYLYKSRAYMYEKECRIVALESDLKKHDGVRYDFKERPCEPGRLRMYGQHPCLNLTNIISTGSVITLGPAVPNVDHSEYAVEQLLRSVGIEGVPIERSRISYR